MVKLFCFEEPKIAITVQNYTKKINTLELRIGRGTKLPPFSASLIRAESYTYHATRTAPKKDKLIDAVDENFLNRLTGYNVHFYIFSMSEIFLHS